MTPEWDSGENRSNSVDFDNVLTDWKGTDKRLLALNIRFTRLRISPCIDVCYWVGEARHSDKKSGAFYHIELWNSKVTDREILSFRATHVNVCRCMSVSVSTQLEICRPHRLCHQKILWIIHTGCAEVWEFAYHTKRHLQVRALSYECKQKELHMTSRVKYFSDDYRR